MNRYYFNLIFCALLFISAGINAQSKPEDLRWKNVVYSQPDEWYGSAEAVRVAQNVLLYQRNVGGWPKNKEIHKVLTETEKKELHQLQSTGIGATIDNGATIMELTFLSKIYAKTKDSQYKAAFLKGINYLFDAQYDNGGWPQFFPLEKGDYSLHITFNDNAMVNVMNVMKAIAEKSDRFSVEFEDAAVLKAKRAFEKGVQVILKTQYRQNGVLTAWCAQHDEITLLPAKARSYELPSLSGGESPGIVLLLMSIDNPSPEIINSIQSAVSWFDKVKIEGIRVEGFTNKDGLKDRKVVADKAAPPLWARFYELEDNRPFFCDRDGIKKYSLAEIGHERRNGYSWYGTGPQKVLDQYKKWQPKWAPAKNVIVKKP
jgi:pectinesterase